MLVLMMLLNTMTTSINASEFDTQGVVAASIRYVQPALTIKESDHIAHALLSTASKRGLNWRTMASIIAQESRFKKDPQQCFTTKKFCADLGISQINWKTWGNTLHLDRTKLLTDVGYNIEVMGHILSTLHKKYGKEKLWYTRYHSFTPSHRRTYLSFIKQHDMRITAYSRGYGDNERTIYASTR